MRVVDVLELVREAAVDHHSVGAGLSPVFMTGVEPGVRIRDPSILPVRGQEGEAKVRSCVPQRTKVYLLLCRLSKWDGREEEALVSARVNIGDSSLTSGAERVVGLLDGECVN